MRLEYFRTLIEVARRGGFLKAARGLGVTQATVSNHIAALEKFFGVELFDRTKRTVSLTKEGEILLEKAKEILRIVNEAKEELKKVSEEEEGTIRVAASTIPGEHVLPGLIAQFKREHPKVSFEVKIMDTGTALEALLQGEADLAAVGSLMGRSTRELDALPIGKEKLIFICPVEHELTRKEVVTLDDCLAFPFVFRGVNSGTRAEVEKKFKEIGAPVEKVNISLEVGSTEAVMTAVSEGLGISVVSEIAARKAEAAGLIKILNVKGWDAERTLYLVRDKSKRPTRGVKLFWNFLSK